MSGILIPSYRKNKSIINLIKNQRKWLLHKYQCCQKAKYKSSVCQTIDVSANRMQQNELHPQWLNYWSSTGAKYSRHTSGQFEICEANSLTMSVRQKVCHRHGNETERSKDETVRQSQDELGSVLTVAVHSKVIYLDQLYSSSPRQIFLTSLPYRLVYLR